MAGSAPENANPTIVLSSKSRRQGTFAKALLKDSRLLNSHPGVKIKTWDKMSAIYQSGPHVSDDAGGNISENGLYMVDDSRGRCGALMSFGGSRLATMGGVLLVHGVHYGISAQHARFDFSQEASGVDESSSLCFDDDSDAEESDLV